MRNVGVVLTVVFVSFVSVLLLAGCGGGGGGGAPSAPVADFTGAPTSGSVPLTVVFTDASTGSITAYSWSFGSGASPASASTVGPHTVTYSTTGTKTISLTVTGSGGSNTKTRTDYINVLPSAPVADFTGEPTSGIAPLTVTFTDASGGSITSYAWNFGSGADPATASTQGPHSVTYNTEGIYTVSLTVTGPGGSDEETKTNYITVVELSPRVIVQTPTSPASGNISITFQLIDREKEPGNIILQYSTNAGVTFKSATLVDTSETQNLQSDWYPGITHTVHWDSVSDMVGISGNASVIVKITPYDATNPSGGTSDVSETFTVNNIEFNQSPSVSITTPTGVQLGNIPINYSLSDIESDTCSIVVEYSVDGGDWQIATMGWAGDGLIGLSSSVSGAAHMFF
jgi:PKD repeat protein